MNNSMLRTQGLRFATAAAAVGLLAMFSQSATAKPGKRVPLKLDRTHTALKTQFNKDANATRLVVLVSPT